MQQIKEFITDSFQKLQHPIKNLSHSLKPIDRRVTDYILLHVFKIHNKKYQRCKLCNRFTFLLHTLSDF